MSRGPDRTGGTLRVAAVILALAFAYLQWPLFRDGVRGNVAYFIDFRAFYCSAMVARAHADPYLAEPLGRCERDTSPEKPLAASGFVVPAPLPGWVILLFESLSRLPFVAAATVYWSLLVGAFIACVLLATRCFVELNALAVLLLLLPLGLWVPALLGQFVPLCVLLLLSAALALRAGNDRVAALLAAVSTMEPHIGLPVCVALFAARPKARIPLLFSGLVLAALSVLALGVGENVEYVARVLPQHIAAESAYRDQFSATYLAIVLGLPRYAAIGIGQASYALLVIVAAWLARTYAAAGRSLELVIFIPMALSVFGGPFVHAEHLFSALPLALYAVARLAGPRWPRVLAAIAVAFPLRLVMSESPIPLSAPLSGSHNVLAEVPWAAAIAGLHGSAIDVMTKIPVWAGLSVLVLAVVVHRPRAADGR